LAVTLFWNHHPVLVAKETLKNDDVASELQLKTNFYGGKVFMGISKMF
jgi:hypothetical protein